MSFSYARTMYCIMLACFFVPMSLGMSRTKHITTYELYQHILAQNLPQFMLIEDAKKGSKRIPNKRINNAIVKYLETKNNELFYDFKYTDGVSYEDQILFPYHIPFADPEINQNEKLYATYGTKKQRVEFIEVFSDVIACFNRLHESRASEKTITNMVDHYYRKFTPFVWRVHLLWLMRKKTADAFDDGLQEIFKCAPCSKKTLQAICALVLTLSYYYNLLFVMPWPSQGSTLFYTMPFACLVGFYYDIIKKSVDDYENAKEFINEKFEQRNMWKKITDELAQKMEKTYKPL